MPGQFAAHHQGEQLTPRWLGWATFAGATAIIVAGIVVAALVKDIYPLPGVTVFIWACAALVVATILAMIVRRLCGATLADLGEGRILWALVVTRFMTLPPPFVLLVFSALASAFQLGFAGVLWLATFYTLLGCILVSLVATLAAHLAAAIRGPGPAPPSAG